MKLFQVIVDSIDQICVTSIDELEVRLCNVDDLMIQRCHVILMKMNSEMDFALM